MNQIITSLDSIGKFKILGSWESIVNGKKLLIGMFKTSGNIIIELIQLVQQK